MIAALLHRSKRGTGAAFTLVELLVTIAIIAVLAGVTMAAASSALQAARTARCASNLRQIGIGLHTFASDNNNTLPQRYYTDQNEGYSNIILPYLGGNGDVFVCPCLRSDFPAEPAYGMNWYYDNSNLLTVRDMSQTILATDTKGSFGQGSNRADENSGDPGQLDPTRHNGEANYLFMDGHVERLSFSSTQKPIDLWGTDQGNHSQTQPNGG